MRNGKAILPQRRRDAEESNNTMSDKTYHELHEWNESLEWKHGESLSIVPSNYRAVLVAFGVFVSFVTKAVLGDLGVLERAHASGREEKLVSLAKTPR